MSEPVIHDLIQPTTLEEAIKLLDESRRNAMQMAGKYQTMLAAAQAREGVLRDTIQVNHDIFMDEKNTQTAYQASGLCEANKAALALPFDTTALQLVLKNQGDIVENIRHFNTLAGNTDNVFNVRQTAMYVGLILEEVGEMLNTLADGAVKFGSSLTEPYLRDMSTEVSDLGVEFKRGTYDPEVEHADRVSLLDDCIDIGVVDIGCLLSQGADIHGAFDEVSRSNMSKVFDDGTLHRDENGKIVKGPHYFKPVLAPFVATIKQLADGTHVSVKPADAVPLFGVDSQGGHTD